MATVMDTTDTTAWQLRRLGILMEPNVADPYEVGGGAQSRRGAGA
jgi:hypothetical protein